MHPVKLVVHLFKEQKQTYKFTRQTGVSAMNQRRFSQQQDDDDDGGGGGQ